MIKKINVVNVFRARQWSNLLKMSQNWLNKIGEIIIGDLEESGWAMARGVKIDKDTEQALLDTSFKGNRPHGECI